MNGAHDIIKPINNDAPAQGRLQWTSIGVLLSSLLASPIDWLKNIFVFHPNVRVTTSPEAYGLPYEEVWFGGTDGRLLHGWYVPSESPLADNDSPLFLWFHGNAGNVGHRLAHLQLLRAQMEGSHFVFDYQGFGRSKGRPSIPGILDDGRAAIAYAHHRGWAANRPVVYFGESLGAAVVVALAFEAPPTHAILLAPFFSLRAMAEIRLPPLAFLVEHDLNSARTIEQFPAPLLVIHGKEDRTIPFQQGQALYDLAPHPKRFYAIEGAAHTNLHEAGGETYFRVLQEFLVASAERSNNNEF
jgi:fermentation-respiration switch protein FrsA (DUF1100 family)